MKNDSCVFIQSIEAKEVLTKAKSEAGALRQGENLSLVKLDAHARDVVAKRSRMLSSKNDYTSQIGSIKSKIDSLEINITISQGAWS
jgi:hypothetical protein